MIEDLISIFIALAVVVGSVYYYISNNREKLEKELKVKNLKEQRQKQQKKEEELRKQNKAAKELATRKKQEVKKKPKKKAVDTSHDPSKNLRYLRRFGGHNGNIIGKDVSPNGEWMATCGVDGKLRVARVEKADMSVETVVPDHDRIDHVSWEGDNRTIACVLHRKQQVTFYRVRKKKDADANTSSSNFPYELVELVKRKFETQSKLDDITRLLTDQSSSIYSFVLTSGDSTTNKNGKVIAAWNGSDKTSIGLLNTGSAVNDARISKDGRFICSRSAGSGKEVKLYEVVKKRHKGEIDPQFDNLASKSVMSMHIGKDVSDVDFLYSNDGGVDSKSKCDKAIVVCNDGTFQIWNIDVEYKFKEDPKLICTCDHLQGKGEIKAIATSYNNNRIAAVAFPGPTLQVFTYDNENKQVNFDFSMENCHGPKGIDDDLQFNAEGNVLYTRGSWSKDIFSWKV